MTWRKVKFPHYHYTRWDGKVIEVTTPCAGSITTYTDLEVNEQGISRNYYEQYIKS